MRNGWGALAACLLMACAGERVDSNDDAGATTDTSIADTLVADTFVPDTSVADTFVADTFVADTLLVDTSVADAVLTDASTDSSADAGTCGVYKGTTMVPVGGYCIDRTEVPNADYNQFLDAPSGERVNIAGCEWNTEFGTAVIDPVLAKRPRANVDWCDAQAYCKWAGKRLCGAIGGGSATYVLPADATKNEWMKACSVAGTQEYCYPGTYDATKCQTGSGLPVDVGSRLACHGPSYPYDAIYDLLGNVGEWEDSCQAQPPLEDTLCRVRAGGVGDGDVKCGYTTPTSARAKYAGLGFRCCKTP